MIIFSYVEGNISQALPGAWYLWKSRVDSPFICFALIFCSLLQYSALSLWVFLVFNFASEKQRYSNDIVLLMCSMQNVVLSCYIIIPSLSMVIVQVVYNTV